MSDKKSFSTKKTVMNMFNKIRGLSKNGTNKNSNQESLLLKGLNLNSYKGNKEELKVTCKDLINKGYMFTYIHSGHKEGKEVDFIILYNEQNKEKIDRKIYSMIENSVKKYNSVYEDANKMSSVNK